MTGEKLKIFLERKGVAKKDLAEKLGLSPQALDSKFNAKDVPSGTLESIATVLGISISEIYGETSTVSDSFKTLLGDNVLGSKNDADVLLKCLSIIEGQHQLMVEKDRLIAQLINKL